MLWCTPRAEAVIARMAPGGSRRDALPPELRGPVERLLRRGSAGASVRLDRDTPGGMLELVLVTRYRENEVLIRINELDPRKDMERLAASLGLTMREAEVLLWGRSARARCKSISSTSTRSWAWRRAPPRWPSPFE
jgi:hypothetical protein